MLEAALAMGRTVITSEWRRPGIFGDEQPAPDDASAADKLLAFAGRTI
jgi:hypothetical protein